MQKHSLGERAWLRIIEDYNLAQQRETYKKLHNGKEPPLTASQALRGLFVLGGAQQASRRGLLDAGAGMHRRHSLDGDT
jgi:hypothetical protein